MNPTEGIPPVVRLGSAGKEFFFLVVLTLSFFLSISFVPLAGFLTGIITPLPTVLALIRFGLPRAWIVPGASALVGALVLAWIGMAAGIPYFAALLAMGTVLGYGMTRQWSSERTIGLSSLAVTAIAGLLMAFTYMETGGELVRLLEQDLQEAVRAAVKQLGAPSAESQELENVLLATVPLIVRSIPGITITCTIGIAWVNMLIARRYCRTAALHECLREDWTLWRCPEHLVWPVIACGIFLMSPGTELKIPALNVIIVLGSIYFLQGLSIAAFYLEKWKLPFLLRGFIYGILVMQQFASLAVALMGLFDMWFDFRRIKKKPATPAE